MVIEKLIELDKKDPKRIAIIGDAIHDMWFHGNVFPCPDGIKFIGTDSITTLGGALNAVNCLMHWDAVVDAFVGEYSIKTRWLVDNKIVFRYDQDKFTTRRQKTELTDYDAILLSDYDKGYLEPKFMQEIIQEANELGIPIVADCKRRPSLYHGAILKGNDSYLGGLDVRTRGSASPEVNGKAIEELPPVKCVNHVGAGDCFAAHLTLALAYGFSLEDAARVAHKAGWVYVQYPHNRPPRKEEVANVR